MKLWNKITGIYTHTFNAYTITGFGASVQIQQPWHRETRRQRSEAPSRGTARPSFKIPLSQTRLHGKLHQQCRY